MALNQWLCLRAIRLQTKAFANAGDAGVPKELALLIRYQTTADRAFHKAHAELRNAQKQRTIPQIGFEPQNAQTPSPEPAPYPAIPEFHYVSTRLAAACTKIPDISAICYR